MVFTENDINGCNSIYCTGSSVTKWYVSRSGLRKLQRLLGSVCLRTWQSYASHVDESCGFLIIYIFMRLFRSPPPKWRNSPHDIMLLFSPYKLPNVSHSLLLPTHYTGLHPVIWRRDVPLQECCTSGIPSAVPKDRFPACTFDSHLHSAVRVVWWSYCKLRKPAILLSAIAHVNKITVNLMPCLHMWNSTAIVNISIG